MHLRKYIYSLCVLVLLVFYTQAQEHKVLPRFSVRANIGIPKAVSNGAFRISLLGVYDMNYNMNVRLFDNFFVGAGYKNSLFKNQSYFEQKGLNTRMQVHNGYVKVGYDRFFSDIGFYTIALNTGYNFNKFTGINCVSDSLASTVVSSYTGFFAEPEFGIHFLLEPNFSIGGTISYVYNGSYFSPAYACFDKWYGYNGVQKTNNTSWISIGFGFYYGF